MLIVNTNGGGHANIGFWLAKTLAAQGHQVTLNVVGSQDDKKMQKPPFTYFSELTAAGVNVCWADPGELATKAAGATFDVVVDNNGKDLDSVGPVADYAVAAGAKQFLFVSSAGMYVPTATPPHLEGDAVKESAGHAKVEAMLKTKPFKMSSFRPQYFTGYGNNKDCEEWFFDRLVRGRPVPIPGSGDQLSVVAHAEDVATMMAAAVGNDKAAGEIFNAVTNRAVTLNGMVQICAAAAGVEPNIVNYDPSTLPEGVEVKKAFLSDPSTFIPTRPRRSRCSTGNPRTVSSRTWRSVSRFTRRPVARRRRWSSSSTIRSSRPPRGTDRRGADVRRVARGRLRGERETEARSVDARAAATG